MVRVAVLPVERLEQKIQSHTKMRCLNFWLLLSLRLRGHLGLGPGLPRLITRGGRAPTPARTAECLAIDAHGS